jgi:hypothetical protein
MTDDGDLNRKGLTEGLTALGSIRVEIANAERRAAARMGEAESELNGLRKLLGFVDIEVSLYRTRLAAIDAKEKAETPKT